ncbi:MAG: hypothetical protein O2955_18995 [Planctomycetota bacterium]|nr:hypothetical protein [Planctomycetota bacterium]MDA1214603.1 hypothetical protein [Planctomycetota bacterium]
MNEFGLALRNMADTFERMGISYAVIEGIAVRAYGIPRPTYDVDFILSVSREGFSDVFDAIEEQEFSVPEVYRTGRVDQVAEMPLVKIRFYLKDRGVDADIFLAETPFQQEILTRRQRAETMDGTLWLASPEDIVLLKLLANRTRDRSDVQDILFTQGQLDDAYMKKWAAEPGVLPLLEKTLADSRASEEN